MIIIGIDPGIKGALAVLDNDKLIKCFSFPIVKEQNLKGRNLSRTDIGGLINIFRWILKNTPPEQIMIEKPLLMPGQNVASTFNNGKSHGIILTLVQVFFQRSKVTIVPCKEWQDELIVNRTEVVSKFRRDKRKQLKVDAIATAQELFPDFDFKKSKKSKVDSDGMADAVLIAYYCYKKSNG